MTSVPEEKQHGIFVT